MSKDVEGARARFRRAWSHLEKFQKESRDFMDSGAYEVVREKKTEGDQTFLTFTFKVNNSVPEELGLTFGEGVNQLRCALDNLVVAYAKGHNLPKIKGLGFPVFLEKDLPPNGGPSFERWRRDFPFPPESLRFFEMIQPFNECQSPSGVVTVRETHPLFILNKLWTEDKHYVPLEVAAVQTGGGVQVPFFNTIGNTSGGEGTMTSKFKVTKGDVTWTLRDVTITTGNVIEDGVEYMRFLVVPGQPIDNINAPIAVDIALSKSSPVAGGSSASQLLTELHGFTTTLIEWLAAGIR